MQLPFFLSDFEGVGGVIKQRVEDFYVEEIPLYPPDGQGDHCLIEFQKIGMTTFDAITRICNALGANRREAGHAGMKDAQAVTRQTISLFKVDPAKVKELQLDRIQIISAEKHRGKLRLGHLKGNRFVIKIREVEPTKVVTLRPALEILQQRGMPNYFGEQRFGKRNNNDLLGAAFVRGDDKLLLKMLLGDPDPRIDPAPVFEARQFFMGGDFQRALNAWPHWAYTEQRVLARLLRGGDPTTAALSIEIPVRRIWVNALQSRIFNDVLGQRIKGIDQLMDGDIAIKHDNGAQFPVDNAKLEQPRADAFEISATGPLVGRRVGMPRGEPFKMERGLYEKYQIHPNDFRSNLRDRSHGDRRALRVRPLDINIESGSDDHGPYILTAFTLPSGSYATILLRELMRVDLPEGDKPKHAKEDQPLETEDGDEE